MPVSTNVTPPPPLVPVDEKKRKSSVKRVRFSIEESSNPSPLRLNADLGLVVDDGRTSSSRLSVNSRRSSVADSPVHFPSQEDLLSAPSGPGGSPPTDSSRQSTGSSVNALSSALSSFADLSSIAQPTRVRSIWDTPSSSNYARNERPKTGSLPVVPLNLASPVKRAPAAPIRRSAETPGVDERRLFQFSVVTEHGDENSNGMSFNRPSISGDVSESLMVVVNKPVTAASPKTVERPSIAPEDGEDDPMLVSGGRAMRGPASGASSFGTELVTPGSEATSVTNSENPNRRRRRRRLSSLEEMESELMNMSSPSPEKRLAAPPSGVLESLMRHGIDAKRLANEVRPSLAQSLQQYRPSSPSVWDSVREESKISDVALLNISGQQMRSVELSLESTIEWIVDQIAESRAALKSLLVPANEDAFRQAGDVSELVKSKRLKAELTTKSVMLALVENEHENLMQSFSHFERFGETLEAKQGEIANLLQAGEALKKDIIEYRKQFDVEFAARFDKRPDGTVERRRSHEELRLAKLDAVVQSKEAEICEVIGEITELEAAIADKQTAYTRDFNRLRSFYLANGWNVVAELHGSIVVVYSGCHLVVFEKARNNSQFWRLDRIVPCKFDAARLPAYAPNLLSSQIIFNSDLVLQHIATRLGLAAPFLYSPETLVEIMRDVTAALCEWIELRESLAKILLTPESRIKINSNLQIEALLVTPNNAIGIDVPLCVKLIWFDSVLGEEPVRWNNLSYIVTENLVTHFPNVKAQIEDRFGLIRGDPLSFRMVEDIAKAITSVLVNADSPDA